MRIGFSIVVCCYNSEKLLPETLRHLANLKLDSKFTAEVILVDNNSTDNTSGVSEQLWESYGSEIPFSIVKQPIAGLNYARAKGISHAKYNYVLFCDDDNWLYPDYLLHAFPTLEGDEKIGVLGGEGIAECEINPPAEVKPFLGSFATGPQAENSGEVTHTRTTVYGAGSIYRKDILEKLDREGFKPFLSDRKGDVLTSGGDAELCWAIILNGYKIWYDNNLKFKHFLTKKRLNWNYLCRLEYGNGFSSALHVPYWELITKSNRPEIKNTWWWRLIAAYIIYISYILRNKRSTGNNDHEKIGQLRLKGYRNALWTCRREYVDLQQGLKNAKWIIDNARQK